MSMSKHSPELQELVQGITERETGRTLQGREIEYNIISKSETLKESYK